MALDSTVLFASAAASIQGSEALKFRGMATLALIILNEAHWSTAPQPHAKLRADLLHVATTSLGMEGPTWQAYAKGMDTMADKFAVHFKGREFVLAHDDDGEPVMCLFDDIQDMPEEDAITAVMALYTSHGVSTGGQIRDWAKQEGFAPFDADLVKRQRKAALEAKKKAERDASALWTTVARVLPPATSNQDLTEAMAGAPASFDNVLERIKLGATQAECDALIEAVNARLDTLAAMAAIANALPEEVMPVLSDDVAEIASPNKVRAKRAKLAA